MALKDTYYTISQAAKELGVTRQSVSRWIREGKLHGERIGRETLIKKDEVEQYGVQRINSPNVKQFYEIIIDEVRKRRGYAEDDVLTPIEIRGASSKEHFGEVVLGVKRKGGKSEMVYVDVVEVVLKRFDLGGGLDIEIGQIRVE
jgi:excisionase family DNA binding protein